MAKRISRKLLVGLGSVVTFGAVGTVSGFGIKSIIDSATNYNQNNQLAKTFPEDDYTKMSNYNVASKDMFINTTDLSRFHFGNVQKGQTVTPYGWIGVYRTETTNTFQNIALIGWNGEVIWSYDNTNGRDVYDVKYDYNTDLLFMLKTSSIIGISNQGREPIELDVLEAKTGRRVDQVTEPEFKTMQTDAYSTLSTVWNLSSNDKLKNLMQIDLISKKNKTNEVVLNWMPNFMQLSDRSRGYMPNLFDFRPAWHKVMKLIKFTKKTDQSGMWTHKIIKPNSGLLFSNFSFAGGNNWQEPTWNFETRYLDNYTLITNPFFTINNDDSYVLHLILASNGTVIWQGSGVDQQKKGAAIIHKAVGITNDFQNPNTNINVFQQMGGTYKFTTAPFYNEYNNWPYKLSLNDKTNWYKFNNVAADAVTKANTRINRNMFDNNSIITPYIYSINSKYPIYDVMQLNIDPATGKISFDTNSNNKKMTKRWSFGQDIVNYYDKNKNSYSGDSAENSNVNRIFPYPDTDNKTLDIDHNYNRLISVSPFDNTFIYAAKPYLKYAQFNPDNKNNNNKYAGFWVSSDQIRNNKPQIRPLVIVNDQSALKGNVDSKMTSIGAIYNDGFTFDPTSLYTSSDGRKHLNLYYNQNGSERNTTYTDSGMKSSKIGLLKDVLSVANKNDNEYNGELVWTTSIADKYYGPYNNATLDLSTTGITRSDFSTLIHSRADLTKWYNRTWKNLNSAGNLLSANERINENDSSSSRAIAKRFDSKLEDSEFSSGQSVDLVSAWKDKADNGTLYANDPVNYNRLAIKRPVIKIGTVSSGRNSLPVITRYEMSTEANKIINDKPTWGLKAALGIQDYNNSILVLQKVQTINNVSTEIVSSWEKQYKMEKIQRTTDQLNSQNTAWYELSNPLWQDKITNPNLAFGNANNNVAKNGQAPLRLMLKLVKPTGSLPTWFSNDFDDYFAKAYPIQPINDTETSFAEMVKEYANKKAQLIDLSDLNNAPVGLGNLKIDAYLELNPAYTGSQKIYYGEGKIKKYLQDSSGTVFIYQDQFSGSRTIYDQSQIEYDKFEEGGFGKDGSALRTTIQKSWKDNIFNGNNIFNIKVSTNYNQLPDTLVRKSADDNSPLFSFDYRSGTNNVLEITPNTADLNWFKNRFENFNRLLNLFVQFEYKTTGQTSWSNLDTLLSDKSIKQNFQQNGNKLVFNNVNPNIEKIRFRLKQFTNPNDKNLAVDIQGFNETDQKYISAEHGVAFEKYIIKQGQIRSVYFANKNGTTGKTLASITKADIDDFINAVVDKSTSLNSAKQKVTLKFNYNNKTGLDSQKLYDELKNKLNSAEPFALSNGTDLTNGETIEAFFALKNTNDSVKFFDESGNSATENLLKSNVVSNLISEINLNDYISQLMNKPLTVAPPPTTPGSFNPDGSTIQFPTNNATSGFFAGMDFNTIKSKLLNVGIKVRFKGFNPQNNQFDNWEENIESIRNYNPTNPEIKIGFQVLANWNVKVIKQNQEINSNQEFSIKLKLPKLIRIPVNAINNFKNDHGLSGNTKSLKFVQNKIDNLVNAIKNDNSNNNVPNITNAPIEVLFQLGDSGDFSSINELVTRLANSQSDQRSNVIKIKFRIKPQDPNSDDWVLDPADGGVYTILDDQNSTIPIFVHDAGILNLIKTKTVISGTNNKLNWTFPTNGGFTIETNDNFANNSTNGRGLKLEFSTEQNANINSSTGWGPRINNVPVGTQTIFLRIVSQNNKYIYEKTSDNTNEKIAINLDQIQEQINIQSVWLNKPLVQNLTDIQTAISINNLTQYEKNVMDGISGLNQITKDKLVIKYYLDTKNTELLTKQQLVEKLVNNFTNSSTFNIAHLWNGNSGIKINAVFDKADANGKYDLIYESTDPRFQELDTSKITTTINFDKVLNWLTDVNNKIEPQVSGNNIKLLINSIPAGTDPIFQNKSWDSIQKLFSSEFGITIQYRSLTKTNQSNNNQDWSNSWDSVNMYDEGIGKFQIRFQLDGTKSKNIKLQLQQNQIIEGNTSQTSNLFDGYLKIKLVVKVNPQFVTEFNSNINPNVVSGNTKKLLIDKALEDNMINKIKTENQTNNASFNELKLQVRYQLGEWRVGEEGKTREEFLNYLLNQNDVDQNTNQISFQLAISPDQESKFSVSEDNYVLHAKETPSASTRIKYFVNKRNWEANADKVVVSGTSSNLNWNFNSFVSSSTNFREEKGSVYLRNEAGNALQLQFSTNPNISYDNNDVSNDLVDLSTKWVTQKPTSVSANINNIKIRIVPTAGFEYEPVSLTANEKAKVHTINLSITTEIRVDHNWLAEAFNEMEIKQFNVNFLNGWITKLREKIKTQNSLTDNVLVDKINLQFKLNGGTSLYTVQTLVEEINRNLNDYNSADLGIFTLWNSITQKGSKINATFISNDAAKVSLVPINQSLTSDLNTNKIYTELDASAYARSLEAQKTKVKPIPGGPINKIESFILPVFKGTGLFANKEFDLIQAKLAQKGITIKFSKDSSGPWLNKDDLHEYDPTKRTLFLSFSNIADNNLRLKIKQNAIVGPNQNDVSPLTLPLAVPRQISINTNHIQFIQQNAGFNNDTKNITFNANAESLIINKIKSDNKAENNNDAEYDRMPLIIKFSVGDDPEYKTLSDLKTYLKNYPDDYKTRTIKYKFELPANQEENWIFKDDKNNPAMKEGTLFNDSQSPLKIYINNKNIFEDLAKTSVAAGGTSDSFQLEYKNNIKVNPQSGSLSGSTDSQNNPKGQGLRIEFTFNSKLVGTENQGSNIYNEWVSKPPTSVNPGYDKLFIRIKIEDPNKYVYDYVDRKIEITLNIKQIIKVNGSDLNKPILANKIENLNDLNADKFREYENKVWQATGLSDGLKNNLKIEYLFKGKKYYLDQINNLINDLKQYETNAINEQDLGILQLWNGQSGQKITTSFILADPNNSKYALQVAGPNNHDLDFSQFITTIDFRPVLEWLKTLEIRGTEGNNNTISNITIDTIPNQDKYKNFKNRSWNTVESAFNFFGITIEYSNDLNSQNPSWGSLNNVNKFDPNKGTFLMRFNFNNTSKSKNIKLLTDTETITGDNAAISKNIILKLKVRLLINLKDSFLNEFVSNANIRGNTKQIEIDAAKQADAKLIKQIKDDNGDRYQNAQLSIQYYLGTNPPTNEKDWSTNLDALKSKLEGIQTDQVTNKIWYRFHLGNEESFRVDTNPKVLSEHQSSNDQNIKIKYYINADNWENKISTLKVTGTSDHLIWNFNDIFNSNIVSEKNDGKVYLRTNAGEAIQVYFTLKSDATYDSPNGTSDNIQDLANKWVSIKPNAIPAGTTILKVKLVANTGFVYSPALEKDANKKAKAHQVSINIQNVLYVDKNWFNDPISKTEVDISALNKNTHLDPWESKIYGLLAAKNKVSDSIARKIKIKYFFDDEPNKKYDSTQLIDAINKIITNFNDDNYLGILQLWNGKEGRKLNAIFESGDPNNYTIRVDGNNGVPSENEIKSQLETSKIFTNISLVKYIEILKREKTEPVLDEASGPGKMTSFNPPNGNNPNGIFNGKSYNQIALRLKSLGVKIEFSKDNSNWMEKDLLKEYDIQKNSVYLKLTVQSSNIRLQLNNTNQIGPNENSIAFGEIRLPLAVPKYIVIDSTKNYWSLINDFNFRGTTKKLEFAKNKIDEFLTKIKEQNATDGNDPDYNKAPLEIHFQIGTGSEFKNIDELNQYLNSHQDDMPDREIKFRFELKPGTNPKEWKIQHPGDYTLLRDNDQNNQIKIYINDKNVFDQLTKMTITGTNDALKWNWPNLVQPPVLDEQTGVLNPTPDKNFGKGLKFEFTFNEKHQTAGFGTNPETEWVAKVPEKYNANKGFKNVYLRIKLTDENYYTYDNANKTITLSLSQVGQKIILQSSWLDQQLANNQKIDLTNFDVNVLDQYEEDVKNAAKTNGIHESLLSKFNIKYIFDFNGNNNPDELINKEQLIEKIKQYQLNTNQNSLGILQLWNQQSGIKIIAKFVDADTSDIYKIETQGTPDYKILNTENIVTTIDFTNVIKWLTTTNKLIEVIGTPTNATLTIPSINTNDPIFNGKSWTSVAEAFKLFGITIQYREMLSANLPNDNTGWVDNISQVKKYNENIGKIQIRFKFDNLKSKNIKLKTDNNTTYDGQTTQATNPFDVSLAVRLTMQIDENIVNREFVQKPNVITGNTKYLVINSSFEQEMIKQLVAQNSQNNNAFQNAGLIVKYKLANQTDWKELNKFVADLKANSKDEKSNKVLFKFDVQNTSDFQVDNSERVLFDPANEKDPNNWKVKLFINNGTWETDADTVQVSGKTSSLIWQWGKLNVNELGDKVGTDGIEIQFTAKTNPDYNDQDISDKIGELENKWITIKPSQLDSKIQNLFIRLKAKAGYVYGPSYRDNTNGIVPTAKIHAVSLNIKREIKVNPKDLLTSLTIKDPNVFVNNIKEEDLNNFVNDALNKIDPGLKQHVVVKFNFNKKTGLNAKALFNEIQNIITSNSDPNYGVLQLWNGTLGEKINAYYDLADPNGDYELIADNNVDPSEAQTIVTGHIRTKINLVDIVEDFKNKKIQFESVDAKNSKVLLPIKSWIMPSTKSGTESLNSISWKAFENRLKAVGVLIKARIVNNPDVINPNDWKSLEEIKEYNDSTLQLAFRFELDELNGGSNIVLSVNSDGDVDPDKNNNLFSAEFKMNIKAPATVTINQQDISNFVSGYKISGDTKNILMDENSEKSLIKKIADSNKLINATVFADLENRLFIEYYLGKDVNSENIQWLTREQFVNNLSTQIQDQKTNQIWFRLNVKNNPSDQDQQIFNIDQNPKELIEENISDQAKVKIFINDNGLEKRIEMLKAVGSTDDFEIQNLESFINQLPTGLKIQWSNKSNPDLNSDTDWTEDHPKTLDKDKNLWIRFKSNDGYVYEKAIKNQQDEYTKYSEKKPVNTSGLKVIVKVKKEWLKLITISNNTYNPDIDETNAINEIKKVLPTNKPDLIKLEYQIKGNDKWLRKTEFINEIKKLKGAKDNNNFILKREEIQVRFALDNNELDYGLNIDGDNLDSNDNSKYYQQLVDDTTNLNSNFGGVINVDNLKEFVKDNFKIQGSTNKPRLIISNREKLNTAFSPYVSDDLFDILYSTQFTNGKWDWSKNQSILDGGKLIGEDGLFGQATIKPDKKFALKFISKKSDKYKVYQANQEKTDGYVLDLSDKVNITIEIKNPFSEKGKTLGLWTRENNDGKYYQGEGGFKIVVANKNDFSIENPNSPQSAQDFLQSSNLAPNEKEALEFVYHIFGSNPTDSEIERVKNSINDHKSKDWISFDKSTTKNNDQWSKNLGLKVGDYVAVAIRVKAEFSTGDNAFVLENNDNSMILPVMQDSTGNDQKPGRISGYKVKTNEIKLDQSSVSLLSMINPELPPLDGWAWLSKLNLLPDNNGNYLGVDLSLELYNEFHTKSDGSILISGSGAKLVKRQSTGNNISATGDYKDGSGNPITDKDGTIVKIYKDTSTNRLSNPEKANSATKTKMLENLGNGAFRLAVDPNDQREQGLLSLFRNQDVDLKLVASKGEGTEQLPDFYLDNKNKTISLKNIISPQIKYPIENEKKITYSWNYDAFGSDQIKYGATGKNPKPENGAAKIETILQLFKKEGNTDQWGEPITADKPEEAVKKIAEALKKDFSDQLKFQVTRTRASGGENTYDNNNIYLFQDLKNKDRISLKIVAKDNDLYYTEAPRPLIINVNGLTEAAPDQNKLQHLRVKQGGKIDGQGSFKVLVSDPKSPDEDDYSILKGWKFMVRVWDKDPTLDENGKRKIKINWTDDQARIRGLANGDKVEWKLVSEDGNPVKDAYYNTIALEHKVDPSNGKIQYNFGEVNYQKGESTYDVVSQGIGAYPETDDQYPENSGFIISGLKDKSEIFQISKENFAKVLAQLQPSYVGINTQGTIHFDQKYFEENYWVNNNGELYVKKDQNNLKETNDNQPDEISLVEFLDHVTFYTHDPVIANYQGGFKFSGNDININNHLTNGDQMWATFDTTGVNNNSGLNNNDPISSLTTRLNDVSGLKDIIDPMSPLWYVLMALAGIATLGTAALIAFLVARHKKLKGKN